MTTISVREQMSEDEKTIAAHFEAGLSDAQLAAATITHGPAYQRYLATLTTAQETK